MILSLWNPRFADIPVESLVHAHQSEYYQALQRSTDLADSAPFIEFMLHMILEAVGAALPLGTPQESPQATPQVRRLLEVLHEEMSRDALQRALGLRDRKSFRTRYLQPALAEGWVEMTLPDRPNSNAQRYRLTDRGRVMVQG